ncbi:MAG: hypothetical protein CK604_06200 [Curvibacter sp. PD_MW3]|nr:MAG: hypothetical protein CK604_06200 [Curvibacter sp. PD_MW3]
MDRQDQGQNASADLAMSKKSAGRKQKQNKAAYEKRRETKTQVCVWFDNADYARLRKIADTLKSPISAVAAATIHSCVRNLDESTIADYAVLRSLSESIPLQADDAASTSPIFRVFIAAMAMGTTELRAAHNVVLHEHREKIEREIAVNRRMTSSEPTEKTGDSVQSEMAPDIDVSYLEAELLVEK